VTGHEFHRTTIEPAGGGAWVTQAGPMGFATPALHASYLHVHWAGHPRLAQRFAAASSRWLRREPEGRPSKPSPIVVSRRPSAAPQPPKAQPPNPLRHHGDREVSDGLVDFAVNVYDGPRPEWLDDALRASLQDVGRYPDPADAERAIARRHGLDAADVLATAGAAEAFSLIARLRDWNRPVVVHPQFTEPDVALTMAGHAPEHVVLAAARSFALEPDSIPADADLVILGNPTNPTSVLHPEATIRQLLKPGRVVVVDEAFMDAVPGERNSLAGVRAQGLIVIRSLTKLWSIPGVRAGYVLAKPAIVAALRDLQPPWSASTLALAAMIACSSEEALGEQDVRAKRLERDRASLAEGLTSLGIEVAGQPAGPFVLARVGTGVHARLRNAGYAVRRCDTFPGLDHTWVRIAVRSPDVTAKLLAEIQGHPQTRRD